MLAHSTAFVSSSAHVYKIMFIIHSWHPSLFHVGCLYWLIHSITPSLPFTHSLTCSLITCSLITPHSLIHTRLSETQSHLQSLQTTNFISPPSFFP